MPLHDYECHDCKFQFEELHHSYELVLCPVCDGHAKQLVSPLADYTGQTSKTVQYTTRKNPDSLRDSHLTKVDKNDTSFLRKPIGSMRVN